MENNRQSLWQFTDHLRLQTANLANLSINDSIWGNSHLSKTVPETKSFDVRVGAELNPSDNSNSKPSSGFNDGWNSFKLPTGSDLLNTNPNSKSIGSDNIREMNDGWNSFSIKGMNDGWNSFKLPIGSGVVNKKPAGSGNMRETNGGWNSFKLPGGSDVVNKKPVGSGNINGFNDGWKMNNGNSKEVGINGGNYNRGLYYKLGNAANNSNFSYKNGGGGRGEEAEHGGGKGGGGKKMRSGAAESAAEKRFKTLPAAEALPRNETIGGYIFVCNNDTMQENLKRQLFGLPPRYRDSVRAITPGLPLFLYNYSTHQLHGIFEAASFGGTNMDPTAWEDKKCPGESRFPAQVRVITRKICEPLEEDSFRPILHHYDGPKFRLELSIPEAISLLDILEEQNP